MQIKQDIKASGEVNDDSYHLGNFFLDYMNQSAEDHIWQIDAATGETESKLSVKSRSIRLARCLRNVGLQPGDVLVVSGRNHLDVHIPFYAAYMNGLPLAGVDPLYKYEEIKLLFNTTKPKMAFCEVENYSDFVRAARDLDLSIKIVTFGAGDNSFAKFMENYDDCTPDDKFKVATFDTNKVYAWLISTSGTTGLPKVAAFKHQDIIKVLRLYTLLKEKVIKPVLSLSSVQWISSYFATLSMITANHIKVQTSSPVTIDHAIDIINKYRPVLSTGSPGMFAGIVKHTRHCDLTCFNKIVMYGFASNEITLNLVKSRLRKDAVVWNLFGQTECIGSIFLPAPNGPVGNIGTNVELIKTQLADPETGVIITKPNQIGELWTKGPRFVEYYNNPEATAQALTADGWFKTGDLLYRDEKGYHFFVERMSSAFRYKNYYVMPMEIELVIREHPGVLDVCVVGVPHSEDGKRAVAAVIRVPGSTVTEQEIKDLVAEKLSIYKHLHGGVIFMTEFPRTVTEKIATAKIKELILTHTTNEQDYPQTGNVKKLINTFQQLSTHNSRYVSKGRH